MNYTIPHSQALCMNKEVKKAKVSPEIKQLKDFLNNNKIYIGVNSKTEEVIIEAKRK